MSGAVALAIGGAVPAATALQQPTAAAPALVFDRVTVVDVERGTLVPMQRVVIAGNRIQAVGSGRNVPLPTGAHVVDASGKYLIPGLWDMHVHLGNGLAHVHPPRAATLFYPVYLANGVTGIRDAGSMVPLDTLRLWRREILAGTRPGPPRQILSGQSIMGPLADCNRHQRRNQLQTCVADPADARHYIDSIKSAGADMAKPRDVTRALYFAIAAEARRLGMRFGGHGLEVTGIEASDSGASIIDHLNSAPSPDLAMRCFYPDSASVARCQSLAERFRRNGTWVVPTMVVVAGGGGRRAMPIVRRLAEAGRALWPESIGPTARSIATDMDKLFSHASPIDSLGWLNITSRVGLPILAGTDHGAFGGSVMQPPGFSLHAELALYVAHGLSPAEALRAATVNPAKMLRATDSLGAVAPGKLADLVLLDADPLVDIANTMRIRAVVANGRYFDRAALNQLLLEVRAGASALKAP